VKHSILLKFAVFILTALSMVAAIGGIFGIVAMEDADMFVNGPDSLQDQQYRAIAETLAEAYTGKHVTKEMDTCPDALVRHLYDNVLNRFDKHLWGIRLNLDKQVIAQTEIPENWAKKIEFTVESEYPIAELYLTSDPEEPQTQPPQEDSEPTVPETTPEETMPDGWLYNSVATVWEQGEMSMYRLYYYPGPTYTVTVYLQEATLENSALYLLTELYPHRYDFIWMLTIGLIGFAAGFAFLMYAAGHTHDDTIRPGGLNRIPLDLYFVTTVLGVSLLSWLFTSLRAWMIAEGPHPGNLSLLGATLFGIILLVIGFFFALAAQSKLKNGFWWKHSVLGFCLQKLFAGLRLSVKGIYHLAGLLPLVWQWLITCMILMTAAFVSLAVFLTHPNLSIFLFLLLPTTAATLALIGYGAYAFGLLHQGAKQMTAGNLEKKIPTKYLFGCFRSFARELNALSETAVIAAQKQTRSERMKSELITNVSHDIKTPLTSIINFVDLLQKPHTPEQNAQYLEILRRQSYQMKRLIEDLIELSKANTGNMAVNLTRLDAAETVNQALGEFSDKLDAARLTPVFRQPEHPVFIQADGRLLWRVLSNLLTNAIKYAMPGTRLYLDLVCRDSLVEISMKNVSKEELRQTSEQLMERFSQGDTSRQSDGSGLGLNIAQSLMEVQGGTLVLELDGDLFKVTISFPEA